MRDMKLFDKIQGCIYGLAIGDALGYPVEFLSKEQITAKYGENGIDRYDYDEIGNPIGIYSDDTQMTLAVSNALINSKTNDVNEIMDNMSKEFISWKKFQEDPYNSRAPGLTCLAGIANLEKGLDWQKSGISSYGCGSAMRSAPIGMLFYNDEQKLKEIATASSIVTHNHPIAIASAIANAYLVSLVIKNKSPENIESLLDFTSGISKEFTDKIKQINEVKSLSSNEALKKLGKGWTGHEAIACALYCVIKNNMDFEKTVIMAANTEGDSDSIASIAGGIVGAYVGYDKLPKRFLRGLENREELFRISKRLYEKIE